MSLMLLGDQKFGPLDVFANKNPDHLFKRDGKRVGIIVEQILNSKSIM